PRLLGEGGRPPPAPSGPVDRRYTQAPGRLHAAPEHSRRWHDDRPRPPCRTARAAPLRFRAAGCRLRWLGPTRVPLGPPPPQTPPALQNGHRAAPQGAVLADPDRHPFHLSSPGAL